MTWCNWRCRSNTQAINLSGTFQKTAVWRSDKFDIDITWNIDSFRWRNDWRVLFLLRYRRMRFKPPQLRGTSRLPQCAWLLPLHREKLRRWVHYRRDRRMYRWLSHSTIAKINEFDASTGLAIPFYQLIETSSLAMTVVVIFLRYRRMQVRRLLLSTTVEVRKHSGLLFLSVSGRLGFWQLATDVRRFVPFLLTI